MQAMLYDGMVCSLCVHVARFGEKDILQCVTKWMAKNTVPVTIIWGVPVWKGGGRQFFLHLGTPRNHKVFETIWGLRGTMLNVTLLKSY